MIAADLDRLRAAMAAAGFTDADHLTRTLRAMGHRQLGAAVVQQWIDGKALPGPTYREAMADCLATDERVLWPSVAAPVRRVVAS